MSSTDPFSTKYIYHLYNKTIDSFTPFSNISYSKHLMNLVWYYRSNNRKVSYSCYKNAPSDIKDQFSKNVNNPLYFQVEILAFCIMPNHYHFLLKQNINKGIYKFMNNITNAFTRYYNLINSRKGPLFIPRYKSRLIHTEEQLIHVSRYIHLNPYSSGLVKSINDLFNFRFSSLREYIYRQRIVNCSYILNSIYFLKNKDKFKLFISNRADFQKSLENIKYIEKWK